MRFLFSLLLSVLTWLVLPAACVAGNVGTPALAATEAQTSHVTASLIANTTTVASGIPFMLGVVLTMEPGWHTYYRESGEAGMPTRIEWVLPSGFKAGPLRWKPPERFNDSGIITYGYKGSTVLAAEVTPPGALSAGHTLKFQAKVKWLACKEACIPGKAQVLLTLPVGTRLQPHNTTAFSNVGYDGPLPAARPVQRPPVVARDILDEDLRIAGAQQQPLGLPAYLALAFVGGFILNFMPCVLPVISIKVLSLVGQSGADPKRVFHLGLAFSAGIVGSFMALAALVVALQQAGQSVGWGFQFQHPLFLVAMSAVVLLLSLSLFGLFYVPVPAGQSEIDKLAGGEGLGGSFFKGVLATVLATPCTAPFLGTAVGFAFTQSWLVILAVFFTVAVGMAFPYVILTAKPGWMRYIPKPGVWMEKFKEAMGFVLLATVVWLLWILGKQVGLDATMWTAGFLTALAFAAWLIGRFTDLASSQRRVVWVWASATSIVCAAFCVCIVSVPGLGQPAPQVVESASAHVADERGIQWQPFDLQTLNSSLAAGKTVFVDFTADWCLTCKANEQAVINTQPVIDKLRALNVVTIKADWTKQDESISRLLSKFGRSGVPLYVIFPGTRPTEPIVLPEIITRGLVLKKLDEAGPSM